MHIYIRYPIFFIFIFCIAISPEFIFAQQKKTQIQNQLLEKEKIEVIDKLLMAIDVNKLANIIGQSAQIQVQQLVPVILSDILNENKNITESQKQSILPILQNDTIKKLVDSAGKIFITGQFHKDIIASQKMAYARYYSIQEIKELTNFYKSSIGKKFINVQDQVSKDVINNVMQKYMPQSIQSVRQQANSEILAITKNIKN